MQIIFASQVQHSSLRQFVLKCCLVQEKHSCKRWEDKYNIYPRIMMNRGINGGYALRLNEDEKALLLSAEYMMTNLNSWHLWAVWSGLCFSCLFTKLIRKNYLKIKKRAFLFSPPGPVLWLLQFWGPQESTSSHQCNWRVWALVAKPSSLLRHTVQQSQCHLGSRAGKLCFQLEWGKLVWIIVSVVISDIIVVVFKK